MLNHPVEFWLNDGSVASHQGTYTVDVFKETDVAKLVEFIWANCLYAEGLYE